MKRAAALAAMTFWAAAAAAQSPPAVGTVAASDAVIAGSDAQVIAASSARMPVLSGQTVTANPGRNADLALARGGNLQVCQSTGMHVNAAGDGALLLALDRGAFELHGKAKLNDSITTPDLRFTPAQAGEFDLRMRITFNGDTCVENRGRHAPQLNISDSFGEMHYLLEPGQHVMFEHGSLRTVMDRETTPCGCPPADPPASGKGISLADAVLSGKPVTPKQAAAAHPFPEAVSAGLAAPDPGPAVTPDERHVQVQTTMRYDPSPSGDAVAATMPSPVIPPPANAQAAPQNHNPFVAVGRFFKRLFVR